MGVLARRSTYAYSLASNFDNNIIIGNQYHDNANIVQATVQFNADPRGVLSLPSGYSTFDDGIKRVEEWERIYLEGYMKESLGNIDDRHEAIPQNQNE